MRMLVSRHLENFLALHDAGNMHEAARRKGISQPALTKSLKLLEQEIGTELFVRTHRGLEVTVAGEALYSHALAIDQQARFASMNLSDLHHNLGGTLRIGVGPVLAVNTFPDALVAFHKAFPSLRIDVETGISGMLVERLQTDRLDIVITAKPEGDLPDSLGFQSLFRPPMVAICREGHPLSGHGDVPLEDLAEFGRVGFTDDFEFANWARTALASRAETLQPILQTTSISVMFALLAATDHYAIVNSMILPRARKDGLLQVALRDGLWSLDIGMICKATLVTSRPVRALRQILAGEAP